MSTLRMKVAQLDKVRQERLQQLESELGYQVLALHPETQLAHLSDAQSKRLAAMERELGVTLVAYESTAAMKLATPSSASLKRISALEKELGLVFVAYDLARQEIGEYEVSEFVSRPAKLSNEQSQRLQIAETEVGLTLMAYEPTDDA